MATAAERDAIIRTVIGEAADQPAAGQAAVAHVILNRVAQGGFGNGISGVISKPWAFEPWMTRRKELEGISPSSTAYQRAAGIVDQVLAGQLADPTGGATHFLAPDIMKARGAGLPSWAQGSPLVTIGGHAFFKPDGAPARRGEGQGGQSRQAAVAPGQNALAAASGGASGASAPGAFAPPSNALSQFSLLNLLGGQRAPQAAMVAPESNALAALRVRAPQLQLPGVA